jgi:hypothetical protein
MSVGSARGAYTVSVGTSPIATSPGAPVFQESWETPGSPDHAGTESRRPRGASPSRATPGWIPSRADHVPGIELSTGDARTQVARIRLSAHPEGTSNELRQDRHAGVLIARGEAALRRADELKSTRGPYALQAAIAACHARAFRPEETDRAEVVALYDELVTVMPSPIVELNRAVAISMASGPAIALPLVEQLVELGVLERDHLLHAVRGDLLEKLGRCMDASSAFERAAALSLNSAERQLLERRAADAAAQATVTENRLSGRQVTPTALREPPIQAVAGQVTPLE